MRRLLLAVVILLAVAAPARALEFGVYPGRDFSFGSYAGLNGTDPGGTDLTFTRIHALAGRHPFQFHTYAQWDIGVPGWLRDQIDQAVANHLTVNLALKYVPPQGHEGDTAGFAAWVADVVASLPQVKVFQVTNEANFPGGTANDADHLDAVGALIAGVESAASVKRPDQRIGFNWLYDTDPAVDAAFFGQLRARGGQAFAHAVNWAGIDIYAGTYFPPLVALDDRRAFRRALRQMRRLWMPLAGLGSQVPIYVQETGYPSLGAVRTEQRQADALSAYIAATAGLNVGLLEWFELTDAVSQLGDGWGLLHADFTPKPAFCVLKRAIRGPRAGCEETSG